MLTEIITQLNAFFTLLLQILIIFYLGSKVAEKITGKKLQMVENASEYIKKNSRMLIFLISAAGMAGTLYYSEIALYEPCKLCWYQRTMLDPQVFIAVVSLFRKNSIRLALLPLNVIGMAIAAYHYIIQILPRASVICTADAVSCTASPFYMLSYITIPLMALTLFTTLLIISSKSE